MSSYDPRQLKAILEDLQDYMQIWSSVARDTLQLADYTQRLKKEYVARAQHRAAILRNQAQEDEYLVQAKKSQYDSIAAKCIEAINTAQETLDKCQEILNNALDTLDVCQLELEEAQTWLERALERLEEAQRQYEIATYYVEEAERRLDQAEEDYEECRNDPDRGSCDEEDAEVTSAQNELERVRNQLALAKEELDAAELEVEQARERVECCERAVQYAEEAVKLAQQNLNIAQIAEKNAYISAEYSDIVQKYANQAEAEAKKQTEVSEAIMVTAYESSTLTEEAQRHYAEADGLQETAQDYVSNANSKINGRIESLVELNRPVSGMWAVGSAKGKAEIAEEKKQDMSPLGRLMASQFTPNLIAQLEREGLNHHESILEDDTGKKAESVARIVLSYSGIPSSGGFLYLKNVISGQYNEKGNGIDLIGVTEDGKPIIMEIKKRKYPNRDSMGQDNIQIDNLEPETLILQEDILRERKFNPDMREDALKRAERGEPDPELSTDQMSKLWVCDRWLKLIKNDKLRTELSRAGIRQEFLDTQSLGHSQWDTIMDGRTTVIVSAGKDDVTTSLYREALFKRGFNVAIIDLTSANPQAKLQNSNSRG